MDNGPLRLSCLIDIPGAKVLAHSPSLNQTRWDLNSDYSDRLLGGSYIGLEFGQMYRRFGSKVTLIELGPRLVAREDEDISQAIADFLGEEGIDVRLDSKVVGVEKQGNSIAVKVESAGRASQVVGTHLLVAAGTEHGRPRPR
jgi:pyruvate/2-oxoglutarate dehydrogenase complex dihydrolipoamide dehydrogenase (E3) component